MSRIALDRCCPAGHIATASRLLWCIDVIPATTCLAPAPSPVRGMEHGIAPCPSACVSTSGIGCVWILGLTFRNVQERCRKPQSICWATNQFTYQSISVSVILQWRNWWKDVMLSSSGAVCLLALYFTVHRFIAINIWSILSCSLIWFSDLFDPIGQWSCVIVPACLPTPRSQVTVGQ